MPTASTLGMAAGVTVAVPAATAVGDGVAKIDVLHPPAAPELLKPVMKNGFAAVSW